MGWLGNASWRKLPQKEIQRSQFNVYLTSDQGTQFQLLNTLTDSWVQCRKILYPAALIGWAAVQVFQLQVYYNQSYV